jgi:hypothetical protein
MALPDDPHWRSGLGDPARHADLHRICAEHAPECSTACVRTVASSVVGGDR